MTRSSPWISSAWPATWSRWSRPALPVIVVAALLCLGIANITARATWHEVEDGVLWTTGPDGAVVDEVAKGSPAERVGLKRGDLLLAIDDRPIQSAADVIDVLHDAGNDERTIRYTVLRLGTREVLDVRLAPAPNGPGALYFVLAAVGVFTLLVGGGVRLRRPRDPATLHFFWLAVAFFGVFTFSFSGRLDRLDWVFYWADAVSMLALPPMFLHFTQVFPERRHGWSRGPLARAVALLYVPALALGAARVFAIVRSSVDPQLFVRLESLLDRLVFLYFALCFLGGLIALLHARSQVGTMTARRQLRWIAWGTALGAGTFAVGYALPYALGAEPSLPMELSAVPLSLIPLAFASAIVRYRLLDIEVIVKRALVYITAFAAVVVIYAVVLEAVRTVLLKGEGSNQWVLALLAVLVAVVLTPPIKDFVQNLLDRAFYRDRYDYRRALIGFARDLNSDLDLHRLSERLVARVVETLLVDRMTLMLADETAPHFGSMRSSGFGDRLPPALPKRSAIGRRLCDGNIVSLDDPTAVGRFTLEEIEFWRDAGLYYFVPCVASDGTIAVLAVGRKDTGEPLSSEDIGLLWAVAGQIATALENARLYRQLHLKAVEVDRMRAFNENILESLDHGLLVLDLDDRVVRWNQALEQLYGVSRTDASGCALSELFDSAFVEAVRAARRDTPEGATLSRMPVVARGTRAGETLIVNAAVVPLRAEEGRIPATAGTIVIIEDVTARVQLEEQLRLSEKMASIGLLAAGVAHEVNTPLTGISSFTQMLLEGADPHDPRTRLLEKIERQTFRAAKIVNGLLTLSRPASTDRSSYDVNMVITDVLGLLEHQFEMHRIRVRRELSETPVVVLGLEHKLQQVFLNLFLNARDAMPKGGWLSIATRTEGTRVIAEVSDTGSGIPSEYLARIYDPFFTTKAIGQGTGLGLSITYGIVREHEGSIECESAIGQGTTFILSFPAVADERSALASHGMSGRVAGPGQGLL